jgi:hypothetical protein
VRCLPFDGESRAQPIPVRDKAFHHLSMPSSRAVTIRARRCGNSTTFVYLPLSRQATSSTTR